MKFPDEGFAGWLDIKFVRGNALLRKPLVTAYS